MIMWEITTRKSEYVDCTYGNIPLAFCTKNADPANLNVEKVIEIFNTPQV